MVQEELRTEVCLFTVLLAFEKDNAAFKPSLTSLYMAEHEGTGLNQVPSAGKMGSNFAVSSWVSAPVEHGTVRWRSKCRPDALKILSVIFQRFPDYEM